MKGRAESTEDKKAIISRLYIAWLKKPQLRLGQLLEVSIPSDRDLFYVEDYELINLVEK